MSCDNYILQITLNSPYSDRLYPFNANYTVCNSVGGNVELTVLTLRCGVDFQKDSNNYSDNTDNNNDNNNNNNK